MLYETHVPRKGYIKVWPESIRCPVCESNGVLREGSHKPFYIPKLGLEGGERICVYACNTCYQRYGSLSFLTLQEFKENVKCRSELRIHLATKPKA